MTFRLNPIIDLRTFRGRTATNILTGALRKFANQELVKEFRKTTKTWTTRVNFTARVSIRQENAFVARIIWDNVIYDWVNFGTNQGQAWYPILPVVARRLIYEDQYEAKTSPGVIDSFTGGKYGGNFQFRKAVSHPGIVTPRRFDIAIRRNLDRTGRFQDAMDRAMQRAARASGHAL